MRIANISALSDTSSRLASISLGAHDSNTRRLDPQEVRRTQPIMVIFDKCRSTSAV
jgi:hypothetical protein